MPFTESFTGSDGTDLGSLGTGWTRVDGTSGWGAINASNELKCTTTDTSGAAYTAPDCGTADHYAQCVVRDATGGASFMVCARMVDRSNYIGARSNSTSYQAFKRIAGSFTATGSYSTTCASGDVLKIEMSGTSQTVYLNGVSRITATVSDSVFTGVTKTGINVRSAARNPLLDDWESTQSSGGGGANAWYYRFQQGAAA